MDDELRRSQHERAGNLYQTWCGAADQLFASARVLKAQHDTLYAVALTPTPYVAQVFPVLLMLRGMGLECLLKALWLKTDKERKLVVNGTYQGVPNTRQHYLVGLARAVEVELSVEETHLLTRLSDYITHLGRYPIAKKADAQLRVLEHPEPGRGVSGTWSFDSDDKLFATLCDRLYRELGW